MKVIVIQIATGATGILTKVLEKYLEAIPGKHSIDSLQKTAILDTSHIRVKRKVLQPETLSLRGGDNRWFRRSTGRKRPVTRESKNKNNSTIIIIIISYSTNSLLHATI